VEFYELFMNFLFETYGFLYPMIWVSDSRQVFKLGIRAWRMKCS
jgi:hypothetical protein